MADNLKLPRLLSPAPCNSPLTISVRVITVGYIFAAIWIFGWLTARFGVGPGMLAAFLLFSPAFIGYRVVFRNQNASAKAYCGPGIWAAICIAITACAIYFWSDSDLDGIRIFERECRALQNYVKGRPEFKKVEITFEYHKAGCVYLKGKVVSKYYHDQLIEDVERIVRYGGYDDDVDYPDKPGTNGVRTH